MKFPLSYNRDVMVISDADNQVVAFSDDREDSNNLEFLTMAANEKYFRENSISSLSDKWNEEMDKIELEWT